MTSGCMDSRAGVQIRTDDRRSTKLLANKDSFNFPFRSHAHGVFGILVIQPSDGLFFSQIITNVLSGYGEVLRTGLGYGGLLNGYSIWYHISIPLAINLAYNRLS